MSDPNLIHFSYEFQLAKAALLHDILQFAELVKETNSGGDEEQPTVADVYEQQQALMKIHDEFGLLVNWYMNDLHEGCDRSWVYAQRIMADRAREAGGPIGLMEQL